MNNAARRSIRFQMPKSIGVVMLSPGPSLASAKLLSELSDGPSITSTSSSPASLRPSSKEPFLLWIVPLRCATMNVGRAAAMKLHDISYAIEGLDVVALQEIDLNVVGAPSFVAFWARKGYRTVFGGALNGFYKVAILSSLALQCVQLELQEAQRVAAVTVGTFEPMLFATVYGFANDAPRTRPLVRELVSQLHGTGHPWVLLGDYNLEAEDLEEIFATGLAHCLDEPFECEGLPSTRSPGQRRIDFGIAYARHATRLSHRHGMADHLLVAYDIPSGPTVLTHAGPKRAVVQSEALLPEQEVQRRWNGLWSDEAFRQALEDPDVNHSWSYISDVAEAVLAEPSAATLARSAAWKPVPCTGGHRGSSFPETVVLRRLRRLLRRLRQLSREPNHWHLLSHVRRDVGSLARDLPTLQGSHGDSSLKSDAFLELVTGVVSERAAQEQHDWMVQWKARMVQSEQARIGGPPCLHSALFFWRCSEGRGVLSSCKPASESAEVLEQHVDAGRHRP